MALRLAGALGIALLVWLGFHLPVAPPADTHLAVAAPAPPEVPAHNTKRPKSPPIPALIAWRIAWDKFQDVGAKLVDDDVSGAKQLLEEARDDLPEPYKTMASLAIKDLAACLAGDERDRWDEYLTDANRPAVFRYLHLGRLAALCQRIEASAAAVKIYEHAVQALPADAAAFADRLADAKTMANGLSQDFVDRTDIAWWLENPQESELSSLMFLDRCEPLLKTNSLRAMAHARRCEFLGDMHDLAGQDAWEARLLREFPDEPAACQQAIALRDLNRPFRKMFPVMSDAMRSRFWRPSPDKEVNLLCNSVLYLKSSRMPANVEFERGVQKLRRQFPLASISLNNAEGLAQAYAAAKRPKAAIAILQRLGDWDRSRCRYLGEVQEANTNLDLFQGRVPEGTEFPSMTHWGACTLAKCYEAVGCPTEALEWVILSREKYPYRSTCGTGIWEMESARDASIVRLTFAQGKNQEALYQTEKELFAEGRGGDDWEGHYTRLVQDYERRGKLGELESKVAGVTAAQRQKWKAMQANLPKSERRKTEYDGTTSGPRFAERAIRLLRLHESKGLEGIWGEIDLAKWSVFSLLQDRYGETALVRERVFGAMRILLSRDKDAVVEFLRSKLKTPGPDRGWACVLLQSLNCGVEGKQLRSWIDRELLIDHNSPELSNYCYALLEAEEMSATAYLFAAHTDARPGSYQFSYFAREWLSLGEDQRRALFSR